MKKIDDFRGDYLFLSNFFFCDFEYEGFKYKSVEHAFQALKAITKEAHDEIANASKCGVAKSIGRRTKMRDDWEDVKVDIMRGLVFVKFSQSQSLKRRLLETEDAELVEGNTWGDRFWGFDIRAQEGTNRLGLILMQVREELREDV